MNKKLLIHILVLLVVTFKGTAQKKHEDRYDKIKTLKINFISSELKLSPGTAEKFWPIFNESERKNRLIRTSEVENIKKQVKSKGGAQELSDQEAELLSEKLLLISDNISINRRNLFQELENILTPQQLLKLHFVENDFNFKVLRRLHREKKSKKTK